jgi:hypothetical protein
MTTDTSEKGLFAYQDYYRTTLLADETDPNKLHDLKAALDAAQVYSPEQMQQLVARCSSAELTATSSTRSSMRAWRSIWTSSTRTARWTSRARPRCSAAPTASCRR